jgi:hypothetical protein
VDVVQVTSSLDFHSSACGLPPLPTCSALFRRTACPVGIAFSGCAGAVPASPLLSQALAVPLVRPVRHTLRRQPHPAPDCCWSHCLVGIRAAVSQSLQRCQIACGPLPRVMRGPRSPILVRPTLCVCFALLSGPAPHLHTPVSQSSSGWVRALCLHPCSLLTGSALFRRATCPVHIAFPGCAGAVPASPPPLPPRHSPCPLSGISGTTLPSTSPCTRPPLVALPREHPCRRFAAATALPHRVRPATQVGARTLVPQPGSAHHLCLLSSLWRLLPPAPGDVDCSFLTECC